MEKFAQNIVCLKRGKKVGREMTVCDVVEGYLSVLLGIMLLLLLAILHGHRVVSF